MPRDVRVCFVGDSFVAGLGDSSALGWVGRVVAASIRGGTPITAYNLGIRRDTAVLVRERIETEVRPRLAPATDPRVVLSFGTNDTSLEGGTPRVEAEETVRAFLGSCQALAAARVAFVTAPANEDEEHNGRIAALNERLRYEAESLGVLFIDAFTPTRSDAIWRQHVRRGDGFHPDEPGYARLASFVTEPLIEWLR